MIPSRVWSRCCLGYSGGGIVILFRWGVDEDNWSAIFSARDSSWIADFGVGSLYGHRSVVRAGSNHSGA